MGSIVGLVQKILGFVGQRESDLETVDRQEEFPYYVLELHVVRPRTKVRTTYYLEYLSTQKLPVFTSMQVHTVVTLMLRAT